MDSNEIFQAVEEIAAAKGNDKKAVIGQYKGDKDFMRVLDMAYNPYITYGITKVAPFEYYANDNPLTDEHWDVFEKLANRELTGGAAESAVIDILRNVSVDSGQLVMRILNKDLRAGITAKSVNSVVKGHIPIFECMLAHKFDAARIKTWPQYVEPKLDGVRVIAYVNPTKRTANFYSRTGKEFTAFNHLGEHLIQIAEKIDIGPIIFDGEIVSGNFNKTVSEVRKKDMTAEDAEYHIFDAMSLEDFESGKASIAFEERRGFLVNNFVRRVMDYPAIKLVPCYKVNSVDEIQLIYQSIRDKGGEGIIVKSPSEHYVCKRSYGWMKIKGQESIDVKIVDVEPGTGKYEGKLGALVVDVNGVMVNVGSGLSDEQRDSFWKAAMEDQSFVPDDLSSGGARLFWKENGPGELMGREIEVEFHEFTPDGSLRHPRFLRFRDSLTGAKE